MRQVMRQESCTGVPDYFAAERRREKGAIFHSVGSSHNGADIKKEIWYRGQQKNSEGATTLHPFRDMAVTEYLPNHSCI